jgi:hypothetical protein
MGMPQIQRALEEMDLGYGNMVPVYADYIKEHQLREKILHVIVSDDEIVTEFGDNVPEKEEIPEDVDPEELPSIPGSDTKKNKSTDDDVFDLEAEIRRLRNQRKK